MQCVVFRLLFLLILFGFGSETCLAIPTLEQLLRTEELHLSHMEPVGNAARTEETTVSVISSDLQKNLEGKPILFAKGIGNESGKIANIYFRTNAEVARTLGMQVFIENPSSWESIVTNAVSIGKKIESIFDATSQKAIVVGHSKGGAEVLYAYLTQPRLREMIEKLVIIQGAIGGSPLVDKRLAWRLMPFAFLAEIYQNYIGFRGFFRWPGLASLEPTQAAQTFDFALNEFQSSFNSNSEELKYFSDKIYYVRSQEIYENLGMGVSAVLSYLGKDLRRFEGGEGSDGLVLTADQKLRSVGCDLGVLHRMDHIEPVVDGFNRSSDLSRAALTRVIFAQIYETRFNVCR